MHIHPCPRVIEASGMTTRENNPSAVGSSACTPLGPEDIYSEGGENTMQVLVAKRKRFLNLGMSSTSSVSKGSLCARGVSRNILSVKGEDESGTELT